MREFRNCFNLSFIYIPINDTCSELGGKEQSAITPKAVQSVLGLAPRPVVGLARHRAVSRNQRPVRHLRLSVSAVRGQIRSARPTEIWPEAILTLTYLPVAAPSREDLGEDSYEWLSILDDEFGVLHPSVPPWRREKPRKGKSHRSFFKALISLEMTTASLYIRYGKLTICLSILCPAALGYLSATKVSQISDISKYFCDFFCIIEKLCIFAM